MSRVGGAIQRINEAAFGLAALCLLGLVALSATLVLARYGLGWSAVAAQEAVLYLHALLVALGLAGALQHGAHVRIDILQRRWDATRRRRVDQLGVLLLAWGPQAETPHEPPTSPPSADTPPGGEGGR